MPCTACNGDGRLLSDPCPLCDGIPDWPEEVVCATQTASADSSTPAVISERTMELPSADVDESVTAVLANCTEWTLRAVQRAVEIHLAKLGLDLGSKSEKTAIVMGNDIMSSNLLKNAAACLTFARRAKNGICGPIDSQNLLEDAVGLSVELLIERGSDQIVASADLTAEAGDFAASRSEVLLKYINHEIDFGSAFVLTAPEVQRQAKRDFCSIFQREVCEETTHVDEIKQYIKLVLTKLHSRQGMIFKQMTGDAWMIFCLRRTAGWWCLLQTLSTDPRCSWAAVLRSAFRARWLYQEAYCSTSGTNFDQLIVPQDAWEEVLKTFSNVCADLGRSLKNYHALLDWSFVVALMAQEQRMMDAEIKSLTKYIRKLQPSETTVILALRQLPIIVNKILPILRKHGSSNLFSDMAALVFTNLQKNLWFLLSGTLSEEKNLETLVRPGESQIDTSVRLSYEFLRERGPDGIVEVDDLSIVTRYDDRAPRKFAEFTRGGSSASDEKRLCSFARKWHSEGTRDIVAWVKKKQNTRLFYCRPEPISIWDLVHGDFLLEKICAKISTYLDPYGSSIDEVQDIFPYLPLASCSVREIVDDSKKFAQRENFLHIFNGIYNATAILLVQGQWADDKQTNLARLRWSLLSAKEMSQNTWEDIEVRFQSFLSFILINRIPMESVVELFRLNEPTGRDQVHSNLSISLCQSYDIFRGLYEATQELVNNNTTDWLDDERTCLVRLRWSLVQAKALVNHYGFTTSVYFDDERPRRCGLNGNDLSPQKLCTTTWSDVANSFQEFVQFLIEFRIPREGIAVHVEEASNKLFWRGLNWGRIARDCRCLEQGAPPISTAYCITGEPHDDLEHIAVQRLDGSVIGVTDRATNVADLRQQLAAACGINREEVALMDGHKLLEDHESCMDLNEHCVNFQFIPRGGEAMVQKLIEIVTKVVEKNAETGSDTAQESSQNTWLTDPRAAVGQVDAPLAGYPVRARREPLDALRYLCHTSVPRLDRYDRVHCLTHEARAVLLVFDLLQVDKPPPLGECSTSFGITPSTWVEGYAVPGCIFPHETVVDCFLTAYGRGTLHRDRPAYIYELFKCFALFRYLRINLHPSARQSARTAARQGEENAVFDWVQYDGKLRSFFPVNEDHDCDDGTVFERLLNELQDSSFLSCERSLILDDEYHGFLARHLGMHMLRPGDHLRFARHIERHMRTVQADQELQDTLAHVTNSVERDNPTQYDEDDIPPLEDVSPYATGAGFGVQPDPGDAALIAFEEGPWFRRIARSVRIDLRQVLGRYLPCLSCRRRRG